MIQKLVHNLGRTYHFSWFLTFIIIAINILPSFSQSKKKDLKFDRFWAEQGFWQNTVNCIYQDSKGFMWFGTEDGLCKFDGYKFTSYLNQRADTTLLHNVNVQSIYEDPVAKGNVFWIGTWGAGLFKFDRSSEQFSQYRADLNKQHALNDNFINAIYRDPKDNLLWIATASGGINKLDTQTEKFTYITAEFPRYHPEIMTKIDSISQLNRAIASILFVGDNVDSSQVFRINQKTNVLIISQGEQYKNNFVDYGWLEGSDYFWNMDVKESRFAGGAFKNRIQLAIENLQPGQYRLCYKSDDSHSYNAWSALPPSYQNIWGIQILPISQKETDYFKGKLEKYITNSISTNEIVRFSQSTSDSNIIWIGTGNGLNQYDSKDNTFLHFGTAAQDPKGRGIKYIQSICQDRFGTLWIGSGGTGLYKFMPPALESKIRRKSNWNFNQYLVDPNNPESYTLNDIFAVLEDQDGRLWVATDGGGLYEFDREKERFIAYQNDPKDPYSLSSNYIYSIFEDKTGVLWVGTWGAGVNKYSPSKEKFVTLQTDPDNPNSVSNNRILSFFEDSAGMIWIGTDGGGLNRFDRAAHNFTRFQHDPDDPLSLNNDYVISIFEDRSGYLWIGTWDGGVSKLIPKNQEAKSKGESYKFISYLVDPKNPNSLSNNRVRAIHQDLDGVLWFGTVGGGLCKFDPNTEKFTRYRHDPDDPYSLGSNYISQIFQDQAGNIWIGGWGGGLRKLIQGEPAKFIQYKHDPDDPKSISHNSISKIYQDHSGALWICTLGGGLNKLILSNNQSVRDEEKPDYSFIHYRKKDGLPSDILCGILEDDQHNFWISTNNGLVKFNPHTEKFITFDVRDGLGSNQFNIGACLKNRNGELYFGSLNGFTIVNPGEIVINTSLPSIVISDFNILNHPVLIGPESPLRKHINEAENIYLSYRQNVFSFEFAALDYNQPVKNQYAYKLEGFDDDWIYTDAGKRYATYTNLNAGEYIFKVKGSNNDGAWNEKGTQVKINISPAYWSTWWFRILFFIALFALAYGLYRGKLKNVKLKTELRAAHDAQMSIMPQADPQIENFDISGICLPANEVGGDFFDYFWLNAEKSKFGIVIGDVSGKAMKSAMTAVMTNGMVYLKANEINSVGAIMTHVNRSMYFKTDKTMFTALCIVALDLQKNELIFSNAGLNEPLLKSLQGVEYITSKGPKFPLGTVRETVYQENKVRLKPGDILILFTDGVPEAQNSSREFFGYEALKILFEQLETSHLSAREIKDSIIAEIVNFAGKTPQHDDMTVIVVKAR